MPLVAYHPQPLLCYSPAGMMNYHPKDSSLVGATSACLLDRGAALNRLQATSLSPPVPELVVSDLEPSVRASGLRRVPSVNNNVKDRRFF